MDPKILGRRVLVVEDEAMVAMLIQDMVEECGCQLADIAFQFDDAMRKVDSGAFDLAILDVNLNGKQTFPIAAALKDRGTPFAFATGYGHMIMPAAFRDVPVLQKPFEQRDFEAVLGKLIDAG